MLWENNGYILKAITSFKAHQNLFKYGFTLWHFAIDDPVTGSKQTTISSTTTAIEGVSYLETCMDYFALPGRSCEKLNKQLDHPNWEVSVVSPKVFWEVVTFFSAIWYLR